MDGVVTLIVVGVVIVLAVVVIRFILSAVSAGADIGIVVKLERDLKNPATQLDRLRSATREICAIVLSGKDADVARILLAKVYVHPNADDTLKEWVKELRAALIANNVDLASKMAWAGPPSQPSPSAG